MLPNTIGVNVVIEMLRKIYKIFEVGQIVAAFRANASSLIVQALL